MDDRTNTRLLARILPSRLGSRVTLTLLLTSLVVLAVAVAGVLLAAQALRPVYEDEAARDALAHIGQSVREQGVTVHGSTAPYGAAFRMREAGVSGTIAPDLARTLDAYALDIGASTIVFVDTEGERIYSFGSAGHVAALEALLLRESSTGWTYGPIELQGEPAVVGRRDIVGVDAGAPVVGQLLVASPLDVAAISLSGKLTLAAAEGSTRPVRSGRVLESPRFDDVFVFSDKEGYRLEAEIPGVDRRAAASLVYHDSVSLEPLATIFGSFATVIAVIAGIIGLTVGLLMARAIARPIADLSDHMARRSADSIAGKEVGPLPVDPLLPHEFSNLVEVFNATFDELQAHQSALDEAKKQALTAKASLDIAVQDSLEGKVLVHEGRISVFNPAAATHLAIEPEDALGEAAEKAFSAGTFTDANGVVVRSTAIAEAAIAHALTLSFDRPGRATRWLEIKTVPHQQDTDTMLVTTRDVTESRRLDDLRTEIVGLVSHDLRAPLTVISGYLDLMTRNLDDAARAKAVGSAQRSAVRMQELLEDLLAATRAEEMFSPTELLAVDLNDIARDTVSSFEHTSPHVLHLRSQCSATVLGEERRLRQVLVNLLTNAMKYSPADTNIYISLTCDDQLVTIAVEDEGSGVPEEMRETIFERFARLESETGARHPGVGLGLYIVRAIVESHGGRVFAEDRSTGVGARFVVTLPLAPEDSAGDS